MRIHDLLLQTPTGPFRLPFHEHLTVVSGLAAADRESLVGAVLGAMTGDVEDAAELRYKDAAGRKIVLRATQGSVAARTLEGEEVEALVGEVVRDATHLRTLALVRADGLRIAAVLQEREPEELRDARERLRELDADLEAAAGQQGRVERIDNEIAAIDLHLSRSEAREARRTFALLLRRREELDAELGSMDDPARAAADDELVERGADVVELGERWQNATVEVVACRDAFGTTERLDPETLERLRSVPEEPPTDLDELLAEHQAAEADRSRLNDQLRTIAADRLPEPSDPIVPQLARHDQDELWREHHRVLAASAGLAEARADVDGVGGADTSSSSVERMERAHHRLVVAEDRVQRWLVPSVAGSTACLLGALVTALTVPLLAPLLLAAAIVVAGFGILRPRLVARSAAASEASAAQQTGAGSYLGFHLRRLEASLDRDRRQRLEVAELEHRLALQSWTELTGGIDPATITPFEHEVRNYQRAVFQLGSRASEIEEIGGRLEAAERACAEASNRLEDLCATYGIVDPPTDEPEVLRRLVGHQLKLRAVVPEQDRVEAAEAELAAVEAEIADLLAVAGLPEPVSTGAVDRLVRAVETARDRSEARATMRSRADVEADLRDVEDEIADATTPALADVTSEECDAPDDDQLRARQEELAAQRVEIVEHTVDLPRMRERREALARRVTKLESSLVANKSGVAPAVLAEVERQLQGRFSKAAAPGHSDERLPLVFDDAFEAVPAGHKWDLLDLLLRMSERSQVLYLTEDPFVTAWARTRASESRIRLLEAESEDSAVAEALVGDVGAPPLSVRTGVESTGSQDAPSQGDGRAVHVDS